MPNQEFQKVLIVGRGETLEGNSKVDCEELQSCLAALEEGYKVALLTDANTELLMSSVTSIPIYKLPITPNFIDEVVKKEQPDAVYAPFTGCAGWLLVQKLMREGYWQQNGIRVLGSQYRMSHREIREAVNAAGLQQPESMDAYSMGEAEQAVEALGGYPVVLRSDYDGVSLIGSVQQFRSEVLLKLQRHPDRRVTLETSMAGCKEVSVGVLRDSNGVSQAVCTTENIMPVGVHTRDTVSISPIQTLSKSDHKQLIDKALQLANRLETLVGYASVRFAVDYTTEQYNVIGVGFGLPQPLSSVSLALGHSLIRIVTKLALGFAVGMLTGRTHNPLNYEGPLVLRVPRFGFASYNGNGQGILKARVQSKDAKVYIGQNFCDAYTKARGDGASALSGSVHKQVDRELLRKHLLNPYWDQLFFAGQALAAGTSVEELADITHIDPWFLIHLQLMAKAEQKLMHTDLSALSKEQVILLKTCGFSDALMARLLRGKAAITEVMISDKRRELGVRPVLPKIKSSGRRVGLNKSIMLITVSGCQHRSPLQVPAYLLIQEARRKGFEVILVTSNDRAANFWLPYVDHIFLEPLHWETVREIYSTEKPGGIFIETDDTIPEELERNLKELGASLVTVPMELNHKMLGVNGK